MSPWNGTGRPHRRHTTARALAVATLALPLTGGPLWALGAPHTAPLAALHTALVVVAATHAATALGLAVAVLRSDRHRRRP